MKKIGLMILCLSFSGSVLAQKSAVDLAYDVDAIAKKVASVSEQAYATPDKIITAQSLGFKEPVIGCITEFYAKAPGTQVKINVSKCPEPLKKQLIQLKDIPWNPKTNVMDKSDVVENKAYEIKSAAREIAMAQDPAAASRSINNKGLVAGCATGFSYVSVEARGVGSVSIPVSSNGGIVLMDPFVPTYTNIRVNVSKCSPAVQKQLQVLAKKPWNAKAAVLQIEG